MPRGATSRRAQATRDQIPFDEIKDPFTVTTATSEESAVRELPFEVDIKPAPEGFKPDRSPAGRKRIPSPFEPLLPGYKGKGWQNQAHDGKVVPFDTAADGTPKYNTLASPPKNSDGTPSGIIPSVADSNARIIHRELNKAVKYLNTKEGGDWNLGLDINITATDVQFNIRDKQARKSKTVDGEDSIDGEFDDESDDE